MATEEEQRNVTRDELSSGVQLAAGHRVVLILGGGTATTTIAPPGDAPSSTTTVQPAASTTAQPLTTSTAQPATTTTAAPATTTTAPSTTTTAPSTTTTSPSSTTTAPSTTTTAPAATPSVLATLEAAHFETAKSFPLPAALPTFQAVAAHVANTPESALLIVGHTDTVGDADYNLQLSNERASAVSAYLRNAVDEWMPFYANDDAQKRWDVREDQYMLSSVPFGAPDYRGKIDGDAGPQTQAAWNALQQRGGVPVTGKADDASRRALVLEYMKAEGSTVDSSVSLETLGCGERHLAQQTGDDVANDENRRVDLFAFEKSPIEPAPAECKDGAHPGCTVYDRWKAAVTGPIAVQAAAAVATPDGKAEVVVELDQAITDLLPDGALILSGDGIDQQQKKFADATAANGVLSFEFTWDDPALKVKLEATAGGNTVTLWDDQAAGDPKVQILWSGAITDLVQLPASDEGDPQSTGASPDDLGPGLEDPYDV
jgi:outer membrane protein OmpA-like peptidoglycan-associated protein